MEHWFLLLLVLGNINYNAHFSIFDSSKKKDKTMCGNSVKSFRPLRGCFPSAVDWHLIAGSVRKLSVNWGGALLTEAYRSRL